MKTPKGFVALFFFLMVLSTMVISTTLVMGVPTVTLLGPDDNAVVPPGDIVFEYNVTSTTTLLNCSLYTTLNGSLQVDQTMNVTTNGTYNFTKTINNRTSFVWNVKCYDTQVYAWGSPRTLIIDNAPQWTMPLPPQTINEDSTNNPSINLSFYAVDADNDSLTFTITDEDPSKVDCDINNDLLTFTPAPNFNGVATCNVTVSDGLATDTTTLTINVIPVEDAPVIEAIDDKTVEINTDFVLQVNAYDPDGDSITYSLTQKPDNMSINSTGFITWHPTQTGTYAVTVSVSDGKNTTSESFNVIVTTPQMIEISDIDAEVDGVSHRNLDEGDTLEVRPESVVSLEVEVKNLYDSSDRIDIENAIITVTVVGIDDGDDIEEETSDFRIRYDSKVRKTLDFKVPLRVDEGEYDLIIRVEDEDELGYTQEDEKVLTLYVDKDTHDIKIRKPELFPTEVSCDRHVEFDTEVINLGLSYEDEVVFTVESSSLNIREKTEFELDDDPWSDDNSRKIHYEWDIPSSVRPGTYTLILKAYYNEDELSDYQTLKLKVNKCEEEEQQEEQKEDEEEQEEEQEKQTEIIIEEKPSEPTYKAVSVEEKPFTETTTYLVLLVAANALVIGVILLLLARLMLRK